MHLPEYIYISRRSICCKWHYYFLQGNRQIVLKGSICSCPITITKLLKEVDTLYYYKISLYKNILQKTQLNDFAESMLLKCGLLGTAVSSGLMYKS